MSEAEQEARCSVSDFLRATHDGKRVWVGLFNCEGPEREEGTKWHSVNWHCFVAAVIADSSGQGKHLFLYDNDVDNEPVRDARPRMIFWRLQCSFWERISQRYRILSVWHWADTTYSGSGRCVALSFGQAHGWANTQDAPMSLASARSGNDPRTNRLIELPIKRLQTLAELTERARRPKLPVTQGEASRRSARHSTGARDPLGINALLASRPWCARCTEYVLDISTPFSARNRDPAFTCRERRMDGANICGRCREAGCAAGECVFFLKAAWLEIAPLIARRRRSLMREMESTEGQTCGRAAMLGGLQRDYQLIFLHHQQSRPPPRRRRGVPGPSPVAASVPPAVGTTQPQYLRAGDNAL